MMLQQTNMTDSTTTCDRSIATERSLETSAIVAALDTVTLSGPFHAVSAPQSSEPAISPSVAQVNAETATAFKTKASSLFAKLPGELRNRICRAYFEVFQEERYGLARETLRDMGPDPLALLQTNRMLRSEASSIFYMEFAPFERIPFAHQRETPDVVVSRIHALCTLLAMRDVNTRITVLCLLDRDGCMSDNECWEAGFSARMLPKFIADETGEAVVSKAFNDRSKAAGGEGEDLDRSICGIDDFYEAQIGNDFYIKHRGHGSAKPPRDGCCLYLEGPLARLNWNQFFAR